MRRKYLLFLLLTFLLFIYSCSQRNPVSPKGTDSSQPDILRFCWGGDDDDGGSWYVFGWGYVREEEGGTVSTPWWYDNWLGAQKLVVDPNSIAEDEWMWFTIEGPEMIYDFGPDGITFSPGATCTLSYRAADVMEEEESELDLYYWNEILEIWEACGATIDTENDLIIGKLSHFSRYAIARSHEGGGTP